MLYTEKRNDGKRATETAEVRVQTQTLRNHCTFFFLVSSSRYLGRSMPAPHEKTCRKLCSAKCEYMPYPQPKAPRSGHIDHWRALHQSAGYMSENNAREQNQRENDCAGKEAGSCRERNKRLYLFPRRASTTSPFMFVCFCLDYR